MYEALTLNPSASSITWSTPDTSESIPSLTGLNVTVRPSISSGESGSLTVGGLCLIPRALTLRFWRLAGLYRFARFWRRAACGCAPGKILVRDGENMVLGEGFGVIGQLFAHRRNL